MKKVLGTILFLCFLYGVYVGIECIRINDSDNIVKPFILLEAHEDTPEEMKYKGLGFSVVYKVEKTNRYDLQLIKTKESKLVLFDTFTLFTKYYSEE